MVIAMEVCEHCGGSVVELNDGWARCTACGRDPDAPGRAPTPEEKQQSRKDNQNTHLASFDVMARDGQIVALHRQGNISVEALAERFGLSKTRIQTIVKVD